MRYAYRVADVRSAEAALLARLPDGEPMQRAAAGLAARAATLLAGSGGVYGRWVLLLVGAGNNGGDALYAGARLARRGVRVCALLLAPDAAHPGGLAALRSAGGRVVRETPTRVDLVVDGIVGIGGRAGLRPDARAAVAAAVATGAPVLAVDTPSGIDVDTGAAPADAVRADVTVTFGWYKAGLLVGEGAEAAGLVELVDIGARADEGPQRALLAVPDAADVAGWWPAPVANDDKYTRGVLGVAAGSEAYSGAAVLCTGGALAGPAGMVRYAGHAAEHIRRAWPETVISARVADAGRVQAWVVGPGLGTEVRARQELRAALAADVPACVDADGLTLLAEDPRGWLTGRTAPTVLTPHDREFARLAGEPPGDDRVDAARRLAVRLGVTVLLKGNRTIVADPSGEVYVNPTGTPVLATAGSGDVLAGLLGAALAGGLPPARAAIAAAFVHGLAGRAAADDGPTTARHVRSALRTTLHELLATASTAPRRAAPAATRRP